PTRRCNSRPSRSGYCWTIMRSWWEDGCGTRRRSEMPELTFSYMLYVLMFRLFCCRHDSPGRRHVTDTGGTYTAGQRQRSRRAYRAEFIGTESQRDGVSGRANKSFGTSTCGRKPRRNRGTKADQMPENGQDRLSNDGPSNGVFDRDFDLI